MQASQAVLKTSIATVSIAGDFREKLATISRTAYTGIENFEQGFVGYDGSPVDVGRLVGDYGLEIMLFQPFRCFEGLPKPYRRHDFDWAERKFDLMNDLGVNLVLVCSNASPAAFGGIVHFVDDKSELAKLWDADFSPVEGKITFGGWTPLVRSPCADNEI